MQVGSSAMWRVPDEIVGRFGLEEIGHAEFSRLFEADEAGDETNG
jgi:hypothetical protein